MRNPIVALAALAAAGLLAFLGGWHAGAQSGGQKAETEVIARYECRGYFTYEPDAGDWRAKSVEIDDVWAYSEAEALRLFIDRARPIAEARARDGETTRLEALYGGLRNAPYGCSLWTSTRGTTSPPDVRAAATPAVGTPVATPRATAAPATGRGKTATRIRIVRAGEHECVTAWSGNVYSDGDAGYFGMEVRTSGAWERLVSARREVRGEAIEYVRFPSASEYAVRATYAQSGATWRVTCAPAS